MHPNPPRSGVTPEEVRIVSPALAQYTQDAIPNHPWNRPALQLGQRLGFLPKTQ